MNGHKYTILDAAQKLGVSKEAIHNRVRRGSLECVVEDGVKFIVLGKSESKSTKPHASSVQTKDKYSQFLEEQNIKLNKRVDELEIETRVLRDQKEQMLISQKESIEQIYREKDEQIKNIINAISLKLTHFKHGEIVETEVVAKSKEQKLVSLKKELLSRGFSKKKIKQIKERVASAQDDRFIFVGNKIYINLAFDYSDWFTS